MKYKFSHNAFCTGHAGWVVYDERGTIAVFALEGSARRYVEVYG